MYDRIRLAFPFLRGMPLALFFTFLAALGVASVVLFLLVRKIVAMMHGVN